MVTVTVHRPGWQRWLGGSEEFERTFGLDVLGRWVYQACDGQATVCALIDRFAAEQNIGLAEAEAAVTTFLQTLTGKGLIALRLDRRPQSIGCGQTHSDRHPTREQGG